MKRNILVFGGISGALVATFMGISMAMMAGTGEHSSGNGSMIVGFASMVVAFSLVFVGIKNYRDKQNGGTLTFGKGFLLGFMISLLASTIYVITWAIEFHYFLPNFIDMYAAMQIKELKESGISGAVLDEGIKSIETASYKYKNSAFYFTMMTYAEILPVGIIITIISSLILKRKSLAVA